jgi:hypothetical protein
MLRRSFLVAGIGLLPVFGKAEKSRANEAHAATSRASTLEVTGSVRSRLEDILTKSGYRLSGEFRQKGQLISTVADRDGVSWKLVLDGRSGEIIGRRLIATSVTLAD